MMLIWLVGLLYEYFECWAYSDSWAVLWSCWNCWGWKGSYKNKDRLEETNCEPCLPSPPTCSGKDIYFLTLDLLLLFLFCHLWDHKWLKFILAQVSEKNSQYDLHGPVKMPTKSINYLLWSCHYILASVGPMSLPRLGNESVVLTFLIDSLSSWKFLYERCLHTWDLCQKSSGYEHLLWCE